MVYTGCRAFQQVKLTNHSSLLPYSLGDTRVDSLVVALFGSHTIGVVALNSMALASHVGKLHHCFYTTIVLFCEIVHLRIVI